MTKEGKQYILLKHLQRQLDLQETVVKELPTKDDGLDSSGVLNRTLAQSMQFMFQGFQQSWPPVCQSVLSQPRFTVLHFGSCPAQFKVNEIPVFHVPPRQSSGVNHDGSNMTEFSYMNYDNQNGWIIAIDCNEISVNYLKSYFSCIFV